MVDPSADWKRALPSTHRLLEHYRLMLRLLQTSPPLNPHEPRREPTPADHVATWLRTAMQTLCPMMPAPSKASLLPVAEAALRGMPAVSDAALRPYWARLERYWAQTEAEGHLCKRLLGLQAWDPVEDVQRQYRTWFEHYEELNVRCDRVTLPLYQVRLAADSGWRLVAVGGGLAVALAQRSLTIRHPSLAIICVPPLPMAVSPFPVGCAGAGPVQQG